VLNGLMDEVKAEDPHFATKPFVCEILGFRTRRVIESMQGHQLVNEGLHFYSNELECGLFAGCTEKPYLIQILCMLLNLRVDVDDHSRGDRDEDHVMLAEYDVEAFVTPSLMESGLTFVELQQLAMRRGGFLLGWFRPRLQPGENRINYKQASVFNPSEKTSARVTFIPGDKLLILDHGSPTDVEVDHSVWCRPQAVRRFHTKEVNATASRTMRTANAAGTFV